jgi:hypothetical protein
MIEVASRAYYEAQVAHVRELVGEIELDTAHYKECFREMREDSSDRAVAISVFALFDDLICDTYRRHFNPQIRDGVDSLLEGSGFLSTSHNRIKLAAALYWIEKGTYERLNLLRNIRNRFAHHIRAKAFSDNKIAGYITSFPKIPEGLEEVIVRYGGPTYKKIGLRQKFLIQSALLFQDTVFEIVVLPYARMMKVDLGSVLGDPEKMPTNLQALQKEAIEMVLEVAMADVPDPKDQAVAQQ